MSEFLKQKVKKSISFQFFYRQDSNHKALGQFTFSTYTHLLSTMPGAGPASLHRCSLNPPHPHHQRVQAMWPPVTTLRWHTLFSRQTFLFDPPPKPGQKGDDPLSSIFPSLLQKSDGCVVIRSEHIGVKRKHIMFWKVWTTWTIK